MARRALARTLDSPHGRAAVPMDRPFTTAMALEGGVGRRQLDLWVRLGLLSHPLRGVFHAAGLADSLALRLAALKLVVPDHCVVTDRTAGWLWGANMILAPGDHLVVPKAQVFCRPGLRLRNELSASGERRLRDDDVAELHGLRVTTPLRTACDLGRLLHRDQALAAMDSLASLGRFRLAELATAGERFSRYRGVVQLRALAPLVDPGAGSPGESVLRLRWLDVGLPRPTCQVPVESPWGTTWRLDLGLPEERFGAEYDGEEFHGEEQRRHDTSRREWIRRTGSWRLVVARKANVYGHQQDIDRILVREARRHGLLP